MASNTAGTPQIATGAPVPGPSVRPITYYLMRGATNAITRALALTKKPLLVMTNNPRDYFLNPGGGYRKDNKEIQYPLPYVTPQSIGEYTEGNSSVGMARRTVAQKYGLRTDKDVLHRFNVVPMLLQMEFGYITNDALDFMDVGSRWIFHSKSGMLNFAIKYLGVQMDIRVMLDPQFQIPLIEGSTDVQNEGIATGTFTIYGYVNGPVTEVSRSDLTVRPVVTVGLKSPLR